MYPYNLRIKWGILSPILNYMWNSYILVPSVIALMLQGIIGNHDSVKSGNYVVPVIVLCFFEGTSNKRPYSYGSQLEGVPEPWYTSILICALLFNFSC